MYQQLKKDEYEINFNQVPSDDIPISWPISIYNASTYLT